MVLSRMDVGNYFFGPDSGGLTAGLSPETRTVWRLSVNAQTGKSTVAAARAGFLVINPPGTS